MDEIPDNSSQHKQSKFNAAFLQFDRLNSLWNDANNHSRNGMPMKWNRDLDALWRELIAHASPGDETEFKKLSQNIWENKDDDTILYGLLMKKEVLIRKLEDKSGKGTAYEDEDNDGM